MAAILHTEWPIMTDLNSKSIRALYQSIGHVVLFQHISQWLIAVNQERNNQWSNDRLALQYSMLREVRSQRDLATLTTQCRVPLLAYTRSRLQEKELHKHIYSLYICKKRLSQWLM